MTLRANRDGTEFYVRPQRPGQGEQAGWDYIETGRQASFSWDSGETYDVWARHGFDDKHYQLFVPQSLLEIRFDGISAPPDPYGGKGDSESPRPPVRGDVPRQHWAIVVGIADYLNSGPGGFEPLEYCDEDARDFYQALRDREWNPDHIRLLVNEQATEDAISYALEDWLVRANPDDVIVLFWSGHGWADPENSENAYFACYDSEVNLRSTSWRMDQVKQFIEERFPRNVLFISDACHSGVIVNKASPDDSNSLARSVSEMDLPRGWIYIASSASDRKSYEDDDWKNGALTEVLLRALSGAADGLSDGVLDGRVNLGDVRDYIHLNMREMVAERLGKSATPQIHTSSTRAAIWKWELTAPSR